MPHLKSITLHIHSDAVRLLHIRQRRTWCPDGSVLCRWMHMLTSGQRARGLPPWQQAASAAVHGGLILKAPAGVGTLPNGPAYTVTQSRCLCTDVEQHLMTGHLTMMRAAEKRSQCSQRCRWAHARVSWPLSTKLIASWTGRQTAMMRCVQLCAHFLGMISTQHTSGFFCTPCTLSRSGLAAVQPHVGQHLVNWSHQGPGFCAANRFWHCVCDQSTDAGCRSSLADRRLVLPCERRGTLLPWTPARAPPAPL